MPKIKTLQRARHSGIQSDLLLQTKVQNQMKTYRPKLKKIKISKLKIKIKTNDYIKDESVLVEMFNNHYINIVEKTSGIAPESLGDSSLPENDEETVNKILKHYENHLRVSNIKFNQK